MLLAIVACFLESREHTRTEILHVLLPDLLIDLYTLGWCTK
jgi:hypothetical protein